ncbi:MAG: alpha/beta fold hydrolase [Clostridia bacterium]|nr:alpha/beta fold hydrolase [Clostridia bacterium]
MGFISRQIEKIYRSVLFRRHDPDESVFYFSHNDFDGLSAEEFSFKSKRGHLLRGNFYYYPNHRTDRLVVFEHGMGNGHNGYFREIELIAKQGYLVYSYDHTGCNRSDGEHIYGLSGSLSDLDDCITALITERGYSADRISVIGHSWGGFSSLNILNLHPQLHSVVAMSGFTSVSVMHSQLIPYPFCRVLYNLEKETNPGYVDSDALPALKNTDRPVFVIHSTDDKTVSYKKNFLTLSEGLKDKNNIEFLTVSGSGHNPTYTAEAFAYKERFFKDLKKQKKRGKLETKEQKIAFALRYDWYKMTEQNEDVWRRIFGFLER